MDFMINLFSIIKDVILILKNIILIFITIITVPTLFREFDNQFTNVWIHLSNLTENGKARIREYSLSTIQFIYEKDGKPSFKKFIYITLILNALYGIAMYSFFSTPNLTAALKIQSITFFVVIGVLTMTFFEYWAYKISINAIRKYIENNHKKFIIFGIMKIVFFMYILPLIISGLGILISKPLGILMTGIFYFSPSGILSFLLNIFTNPGSNMKNYFLLLPAISTFAPIIYFLVWEFFYSTIRKVILPCMEWIDRLSRYLNGKNNSKIAKKLIWGILLISLLLQ